MGWDNKKGQNIPSARMAGKPVPLSSPNTNCGLSAPHTVGGHVLELVSPCPHPARQPTVPCRGRSMLPLSRGAGLGHHPSRPPLTGCPSRLVALHCSPVLQSPHIAKCLQTSETRVLNGGEQLRGTSQQASQWPGV